MSYSLRNLLPAQKSALGLSILHTQTFDFIYSNYVYLPYHYTALRYCSKSLLRSSVYYLSVLAQKLLGRNNDSCSFASSSYARSQNHQRQTRSPAYCPVGEERSIRVYMSGSTHCESYQSKIHRVLNYQLTHFSQGKKINPKHKHSRQRKFRGSDGSVCFLLSLAETVQNFPGEVTDLRPSKTGEHTMRSLSIIHAHSCC